MPAPWLLAKEVVWTTYKKLFGYFNFLRYMKNSLVVAVITIDPFIERVPPGCLCIFQVPVSGRKLLMCIFLSNNMFPTVLLMIPLYSIMRQIGLLYTPGALVLSYTTFTIPFTIWLLQGFIRDFPFSLEEAALVDGCSRLTAFFHVFLPIMKQCLIAAGVYIFMQAWNEYTLSSMFTNPPDKDHTSGPQQPDRTAGGGVGYAVCWRHGCHPSCVRHVLLCTEEAGGRADRRGCEGLGKVRDAGGVCPPCMPQDNPVFWNIERQYKTKDSKEENFMKKRLTIFAAATAAALMLAACSGGSGSGAGSPGGGAAGGAGSPGAGEAVSSQDADAEGTGAQTGSPAGGTDGAAAREVELMFCIGPTTRNSQTDSGHCGGF